MKKLVSALLSLCIVGGVTTYAPESVVSAHSGIIGIMDGGELFEEYSEDKLLFLVFSDYAIVQSNNNGKQLAYGDIVIPSEYRGVPVIGIELFDGCTELKSITLPDTITKIADYTFENCT